MIRNPALPLAALALLLGSLAPDRMQAADNTAVSVIDRMLLALGSDRSRRNARSLTSKAEGRGPAGDFVTTVTSIRPDAVYFRQETPRGMTEVWSTPERTWGGTSGEEYAEYAETVRNFVRGHEFHAQLLDLRKRFSDFELDGRDRIGGTDCQRLSMTDEEGKPASLCVATETGLPVELRLDPSSSAAPIRIRYGDWREVQGLMLFHSFELTEGEEDVYTYEFTEISTTGLGQRENIPAPSLPTRRPRDS